MTWNYRLMKRGSGEDISYHIVEMYYIKDGEDVCRSWGEDPSPVSDTPEGIREVLDMMARALTLPIVDDDGDDLPPASANEGEVMNWQPIETAPKDGTVILVATFKMGTDIASAAWRGDFWDIHHWDSPADMYERYDREFGNPTHWMPLPPPPAS